LIKLIKKKIEENPRR
jgi:hypothetical protein